MSQLRITGLTAFWLYIVRSLCCYCLYSSISMPVRHSNRALLILFYTYNPILFRLINILLVKINRSTCLYSRGAPSGPSPYTKYPVLSQIVAYFPTIESAINSHRFPSPRAYEGFIAKQLTTKSRWPPKTPLLSISIICTVSNKAFRTNHHDKEG